MILKATETQKKVSTCDFCKENKAPGLLTETRNVRYSPEQGRFGQEVVCNKCLSFMGGIK